MSRTCKALAFAACMLAARVASADLLVDEQRHNLDLLPAVPAPFKLGFFAREPMLMHPSAVAFDARGRLFVGGGPQFRKPSRQTPPDTVLLLPDDNQDGKADRAHAFATGFNSIQGLAWRGKDLYVANAPDLTLVRDLDGDDVADEYIKIFENLGHNRHGLHGLVFGPDGWLYMSQGNSGVSAQAPKAFRDLMGVKARGGPVQSKKTDAQHYKHGFIDAWPELEGGVLRAHPDGSRLQIFARGMRNPFDMDFDANFDWLATDNDAGPEHDRVITPFAGAHFGKRHPWFDSWDGENSPGTVPLSGLFPNANGSGVGVVFYTAPQWPTQFQNLFLIGDWIRKSVYAYRSSFVGAHRQGTLEEIFSARGTEALFRPTDMTVGADGALYIAGWGSHYGSKQAPYQKGDDAALVNEGRVFRMWNAKAPLVPQDPRYKTPMSAWSAEALATELGSFLPARSVGAQTELLRRPAALVAQACKTRLVEPGLQPLARTWLMWTLGQLNDRNITRDFEQMLHNEQTVAEVRIQALRILARQPRQQQSDVSKHALAVLDHGDARLRFEAALALGQLKNPPLHALLAALADESERLVRYALWKALATHYGRRLAGLLSHKSAGVRQAALLALFETDRVSVKKAKMLAAGNDTALSGLAKQWLQQTGAVPAEPTVAAANVARQPLSHETTLPEVEKALSAANPARGKELFFAVGGAGCHLCHAVGGKGQAVGPDLSDLGSRAKASYVAQSILDPNATIIEGYMQALITTKEGKEFAGVVREDTNKVLRLYQADGTQVVLPKPSIAKRELLDTSAMPGGYGTFLSPADIADMTAWLMMQRTE